MVLIFLGVGQYAHLLMQYLDADLTQIWFSIQNWFSIKWTAMGDAVFSLMLQFTVCQTIHWCPYSTKIQYETEL